MKIQVLDHGSVEFIEAWGVGIEGRAYPTCQDDSETNNFDGADYEVGIIEAARQSTQGSFRGWEGGTCNCGEDYNKFKTHFEDCPQKLNPGDARLLAYLYNNQHSTPFEFAGMTLEIEAPIFVFREWHRHRTQSYNEKSARYAPLPDKNYIPTVARVLQTANGNRQAMGIGDISPENAAHFVNTALPYIYEEAERGYQAALESGIPKELARLQLPVGRYSGMRASANLRNWLSFLTLRCDPKAQWEIRQYAEAVAGIVKAKFPQTYKLWSGE